MKLLLHQKCLFFSHVLCCGVCSPRFASTLNRDYGPYLVSVNGLSANDVYYWELLVQTADGKLVNPGVGEYLSSSASVCLSVYLLSDCLSGV